MENFILIAVFVTLGILFRRLKAFPPETVQVLNMFALYVSLPAVILLKVPQIKFSGEVLLPITIAWGALFFSVSVVLAAARLLNWPRAATGVLLLVVPLGNTSFMGVPIISAFFGDAGLRHLVVYDQFGTMLIFATYGSLILAFYGREGSATLRSVLARVLFFPPSVALAAGLVLLSWQYPLPLERLLQTTADTLTPLVMTAIGYQLRLRLSPTLRSPLFFGLVLKLILTPLAALLICKTVDWHGLAVDVSIIEAGMPPMVTAGALAVIAGMNSELSAALVSLGLLTSFATLPLFYWLIHVW
ncbi:MAG: AEC family transporter [Desulfuromonadaceae bacterium]|nr:AEC family transporter [Desulfuromonadaceae bacterium]